jgi:hypothetical protein
VWFRQLAQDPTADRFPRRPPVANWEANWEILAGRQSEAKFQKQSVRAQHKSRCNSILCTMNPCFPGIWDVLLADLFW